MDISQHSPTTTTTIHPTPLCWLVPDRQGCLAGVTCWGGGCLSMGKGGWGHRWAGGEASEGDPTSCLVRNGIRICRWERTRWGQRAAREVASILTAGLPGAPFLRQLGQSCAPRSSPAVPVPGSCCRRKVNGDGSRHGKAWGAGGCPGSSGCCSVRCLRCSGDAQGFPGDAARDARRRLPAQEVREGAYRDGREMLGMC